MFRFWIFLLCVIALCLPRTSHGLGRRVEEAPGLRETLAAYGVPALKITESAVVASGERATLVFEMGSRKLVFNQVLVLMNGPLTERNGRYYLSSSDIHFTLHPLLAPGTLRLPTPQPVIVLDPGHGGRDGGAVATGHAPEKVLVLDIAKRLHTQLQEQGMAVRMTRDDDRNLALRDRAALAARWKADLFVSLHLNAAANTAAHGIETYVLPAAGFPSTSHGNSSMDYTPGNQHDAFNMALAHAVHREVLARTQAHDRGIRRARFAVLREAPCPAILLECGFLSHAPEAGRLGDAAYRQTLAEGIAAGLRRIVRPGGDGAH